ncbi:VanZ family protein [Microbacterium sp. NC79]|uniref:VanZ family protein n=1 Tax=Microbacterium sp. NC79 TaxID=2851009 RepID=UPI001C2C1FBB|nr:VanZ family protein [Microbacterium sp. NC79]MBV0894062.1 VanZ family protein [Microbacterium sp. NC79]
MLENEEPSDPSWASPMKSHRRVVIERSTFAGYFALILIVTMWPKPVTEGASEVIIEEVLRASREAGAPESFNFNALQLAANVAMFVPFGALLAMTLTRKVFWIATVSSFLLSSSIEAIQQVFLPERQGDPWDVLMNTMGGAIGATVTVLIRMRTQRNVSKGVATFQGR